MKKEIVYLESIGGTVKKEGKNFGKAYYNHRFMLGSNIFNVFELADAHGIFKYFEYIRQNGVERLTLLNGTFDIYVNYKGDLVANLLEIERVL